MTLVTLAWRREAGGRPGVEEFFGEDALVALDLGVVNLSTTA
jgi:hypothetical protein